MKKLGRSLLCLVLMLTLIFSVSLPAFAGVKTKPVVPVIRVVCYGGSEVTNEDGTTIPMPLEKDEPEFYAAVAVVAAKIALQMNVPGAPFDKEAFIKDMGRAARLMTFNCDKDGNPLNGSTFEVFEDPIANHMDRYEGEDKETMCGGWAFEIQAADAIGYDNVYVFNYDSRLDSVQSAKELDEYIQMVKRQTGSDRVSLVGDSQGGMTMATYFDGYMQKGDVDRALFVNPAFAGVAVTRMFEGDFTVDADGLTNCLLGLGRTVEDGRYEDFITLLVYLLQYQIHVLANNMSDLGEDEELLEQLFLEVFKPVLGNVPVMYEFIPYDDFDAALAWLTKIGFLDTKENAKLIRKIKRYHKVQGRLAQNLQNLEKYGTKAAVIADYGMSGIPVTSEYNNQTDDLIDTKYASAYATVAEYEQVLPQTTGKYLSPDRVIDASTCALPDQTWFIRGVMHTIFNYGLDPMNWMCDMLLGKTEPNLKAVRKKYGYSQFLKVDNPDDQNLSNITEEDMPAQD